MSDAQVDIIMRTKDRPAFLRRALASVLAQTHQEWNICLVNSGDKADVDDAVEACGDGLTGRITRVEAQGETSLGKLLNLGAKAGSAKYVVVLDDDDSWNHKFLARTIHGLEHPFHPMVGGVVAQTWVIYEDIREDGKIVKLKEYGLDEDLRNLTVFRLAGMNRFSPNSFVYKREVYDKIGYFDEDLPVLEDWDFNLRFIMEYEMQVLPEYLANYHLRPKIAAGDFSNTFFGREQQHIFFESFLINRHLRKEMAEGKMGVGFLMSHSHAIRTLDDRFRRLQKKLESISDKVGKIDSRSKTLKDRIVSDH